MLRYVGRIAEYLVETQVPKAIISEPNGKNPPAKFRTAHPVKKKKKKKHNVLRDSRIIVMCERGVCYIFSFLYLSIFFIFVIKIKLKKNKQSIFARDHSTAVLH